MTSLTPSPRRPDAEPPPPAGVPGAGPVDGGMLAALAFDTVPVALAITTPDGRCVQVNQAMCDLLGHAEDQLLGHTYRTLTHPDDVPLDEQALVALFAADGPGPAVEKRFRHADGHFLWARATATLLRGADGALVGAAVVVEDIAERRQRDAELHRLALHDPLTGVRNRARLDDDIERALGARDSRGGVVAVLYLDVDDFKGVNDRHGHVVGDRVLIALSSRLRDAVREEDTVARLGGDEFVLVAHLPGAAHADELRARVEEVCAGPVHLGDLTLQVHVSVGMTLVGTEGASAARVLSAADSEMYAVKRSRKRCAVG
jgi:diguanylate cyclase (GGDEF)-like protein/PAS domain S-box-containing protein